MLASNLERNGVDLAFETNLLYIDVSNNRIGIGTDSPGAYKLDVAGSARITQNLTVQGNLDIEGETTQIDTQNLEVEDNMLVLNKGSSRATDAGIMINRGDDGDNAIMLWDEGTDTFRFGITAEDGSTITDFTSLTLQKVQAADPVGDDDLVTKRYFDANSSSIADGTELTLGTPQDSTQFTDGAYLGLTTGRSVTDAIDDLNETMENIREGTYVQSVDFTADNTIGGAGLVVTLTITTVGGGADRYTITWGDGDTTTATTDSTPSHTYNTNVGSPFDVTVRAFANGAITDSAGSFAEKTRENYITIFTATPVPNFNIYAASTGGSAITRADSGSTVYLENTTTNTGGATVTYEVDWGDGNTDTIASDTADGGVSGDRLAHTYTNSASDDGTTVAGTGAGDTRYRIRLTLLTHSTATPSEIPASQDKNFDVYSTHTPKIDVSDSVLRGVNEEATSGFPVTFTNGTDTNPGDQSVFTSNVYAWDFGEGAGDTNVNVGTGVSGDTGQTISNTFNLSSGQQSAGTTATFDVDLTLTTLHSSSPFTSAVTQIIVEPDVRANIAGVATTASTGSGDNNRTLYDHTDLDGNNRALVTFTNTSQNADAYEYDFFDDSSDVLSVAEDGSTAGSTGTALSKNFSGTSNGSFTTDFRATGTPDTIHQNDNETVTFTMKAVPAAPANLSTKSLTLSDTAQGTNPKLCASFTDNTSTFSTLTAGASLNTTTARRYTTGTIDTNTVSNFYNGASGTLKAVINATDDGTKTFTSTEGETGTFTSLVVSSNVDYDTVVGTYPQRFYLVASAKITKALSGYGVGLSAQRLEHSDTGDTNVVHVLKDDITATPTTTIGTISEGTQGTYQYVSGIPYYDSGSPTLSISGTTVANLTGQAFNDSPNIVEIDPATVSEGSGNVISNNDYGYSDIDGAVTMLSSGVPITDTGVSSAYTIGDLTANITTANVFSVQTIRARARNCNGTGSYSTGSTKIQVFTATASGLNKDQGGITVSDSLGATHDDDAVRIQGFGSSSGDTPSLFDSSNANYYTDSAWSGAVTVAGTNEAIVRPTSTSAGTIQHYTTDLSSGHLPVGPDLNTGRSGAQYYTFAFRRASMANFTVRLTGTVSGFFIAAPGTAIDDASGLNGWLDAGITYGGSGVPGSDTGNGGNGSNGCAFTSGDRIIDGTSYSNQTFTLTLGSENGSNATGNNILVRIKLESGDSVTALSIE